MSSADSSPIPLPCLVIIRGLPGSGKSYVATVLNKQLQARLSADSTVMLDPDASDHTSHAYQDLVAQLTTEGVDPKFHPYRFLRGQAHAGITDGKVIIWNQPFTSFDGFNKTIINLTNHATEHKVQLPILVVEVHTDPAVAKARVNKRKEQGGHGPSDRAFARFTDEYESFAKHGFQTITIRGEEDVNQSAANIVAALEQL